MERIDTEAADTARKRRWQQVLYILAPFFLLLVCLGLINFVPNRLTAVPTASSQLENGTAAEVPPAIVATPLPTATISPSPTPAPTPIPTATLPPDAIIKLLGPPPDSSFRRTDTITFYADWPLPLAEAHQLAAYVRFDDHPPVLLNTLNDSNAGQRYRWQMTVGEMTDTAVSLEWWVQLQTDSGAPPLLISPVRQITLLP